MEQCMICVEPFTKYKRVCIKCEYCDYNACKVCVEKWILTQTKPKCMNNECDREWTRKYISNVFSNKFVNKELKKHREDILFDQQKGKMPATQQLVETEIQCEKLDDEIRTLDHQKFALDRKIRSLYIKKREIRGAKKRNQSNFHKKCTFENCRGFLSSQWKCGICENWTCPDCHEVKGKTRDCEHVCDENTKATAALLANDTKPCPNCGVNIHKIDGCDQMWCPECHSAFSWRTGTIERNIHNPHYYEWMRRTGGEIPRDANEVQCGRELDHNLIGNITRGLNHIITQNKIQYEQDNTDLEGGNPGRRGGKIRNSLRTLSNMSSRISREIIHYRFSELPRYNIDNDDEFVDFRVKYLRNMISENEFKYTLQRKDKVNKKKQDISNVFTMFINTSTDVIYRFVDFIEPPYCLKMSEKENIREAAKILNEINTIIIYANECLEDIGKSYNVKSLRIDTFNLNLAIDESSNVPVNI